MFCLSTISGVMKGWSNWLSCVHFGLEFPSANPHMHSSQVAKSSWQISYTKPRLTSVGCSGMKRGQPQCLRPNTGAGSHLWANQAACWTLFMWWNPVKVWACHGKWEALEECIVFGESQCLERWVWREREKRRNWKENPSHHISFSTHERGAEQKFCAQFTYCYDKFLEETQQNIFFCSNNNRVAVLRQGNRNCICWADSNLFIIILNYSPTVWIPCPVVFVFANFSYPFPERFCFFSLLHWWSSFPLQLVILKVDSIGVSSSRNMVIDWVCQTWSSHSFPLLRYWISQLLGCSRCCSIRVLF